MTNLLFILLIIYVFLQTVCTSPSEEVTNILNGIQTNYEKRVRPYFGEKAVKVGVSMYILGIDSVSENDLDFTVDMYFRQYWVDDRLKFNSSVNTISLIGQTLHNYWIPDTFFPNEKSPVPHQLIDGNSLMKLNSSGGVIMSLRKTATFACFMNLKYFPLDSQFCNIEIESYVFSAADVDYFWLSGQNSFAINSRIQLPNFYISGQNTFKNSVSLSTGNYSRLIAQITFSRIASSYFFHIYVPSAIIVFLSCLSLWIDNSNVRMGMGIITILSMILIIYNPHSTPSKTAYTKSLDVYLGFCFFIVVISFLQFGLLLLMSETRRSQGKPEQLLANEEVGLQTRKIELIKLISKYVILVFYVVFLFLYWIITSSLGKSPLN